MLTRYDLRRYAVLAERGGRHGAAGCDRRPIVPQTTPLGTTCCERRKGGYRAIRNTGERKGFTGTLPHRGRVEGLLLELDQVSQPHPASRRAYNAPRRKGRGLCRPTSTPNAVPGGCSGSHGAAGSGPVGRLEEHGRAADGLRTCAGTNLLGKRLTFARIGRTFDRRQPVRENY